MNGNLTVAAQTIKDTVSALDVGRVLGLEVRRGRCRCPIHGGDGFNCVLYSGSRGFYCHVCKAGGDVISFVREYNGMSFREAVGWFNDTFGLGMDIESPMSPEAAKQAENARKRRRERIEFLEWKKRTQFGLMLAAGKIVERMEEVRDERRPRTYGEWDKAFCEAVRFLPEARRFEEECEMECVEVKEK